MRIFTCTPIEFSGGTDFFSRDSGLLSRGLKTVGVESLAVMPGMPHSEDEADLIRTDYSNLESADWWRALRLDGLVLYAWGRPRFRMVATAIRDAGVFLILNQDHGGLMSPRAGFRPWLREQWIVAGQGRSSRAILLFLKRTLMGLSSGLVLADPLRAAHLQCGNVISCVSPEAAANFRTMCRRLAGTPLEERVTVIPHPVEPRFVYRQEAKHRQIVCVGRWQDEIQKRTWLLLDVIKVVVSEDELVTVVVAGTVTPSMETWYQALDCGLRERIILAGRLERDRLVNLLGESQVFYSPSAFESFGIAAGEALCCGCSVVAERSVSMTSFEWFVEEQSGRLVEGDASAHAKGLLDDLLSWEEGERDPNAISKVWSERLHADKVAKMVVRLVEGGE